MTDDINHLIPDEIILIMYNGENEPGLIFILEKIIKNFV